jgi:hypothetical protein
VIIPQARDALCLKTVLAKSPRRQWMRRRVPSEARVTWCLIRRSFVCARLVGAGLRRGGSRNCLRFGLRTCLAHVCACNGFDDADAVESTM